MISIRCGLFETNSSSVHCMVVLPDEEFKKWEDGLYFCASDNKVYTEEEVIERIKNNKYYKPFKYDETENGTEEEQKDQFYAEFGYYSYSEWNPDRGWYGAYEEDINHYTTPGGEKLTIRCYYGRDS